MKRSVASAAILMLLVPALWLGAQAESLTKTATAPKLDGVIGAKEYSLSLQGPAVQLGMSWVGDTLYVAMSGQTTGWIAVGLGSPYMDGAVMYMGYVTDTKGQMKVQQGTGHRHGDVNSDAPTQFALKEANGQTTMELALKADALIAANQTKLDVILAYGNADSFNSMHRAHFSTAVDVAP